VDAALSASSWEDHYERPRRLPLTTEPATDGRSRAASSNRRCISSEETAAFLHDLADQLEDGPSFTISASEWEIPFDYSDPVEVEIEFSAQRERELEIELEFTEPSGVTSCQFGK